ncbi:hypothetical protein Vadar_022896 [Vaccinium darrowii]|uniref:Uncharacterized protein n=1 Tax=Vaccinium darrowii TaxID=229202 RepID=A0ACB7YA14_9ERIC|nr:hypothetical protein Vadar_022896 [Vaccinium darrowii]
MASAVVAAGQWIGKLLTKEAKLLYGVEDQVKEIVMDLQQMQCFIIDADENQDRQTHSIRNLVAQIREAALHTEDVILRFVVEVELRKDGRGVRGIFMRYACMSKEVIARHTAGSEIVKIHRKIANLKSALQSQGLVAVANQRRGTDAVVDWRSRPRTTYSHVDDEEFFGSKDVMEEIVNTLLDKAGDRKPHKAVPICGMGGLGKTTLARKVYHHEDIRHHFTKFAWVCISQQWQSKDVFQQILIGFMPGVREEILKKTEDELVGQLREVQKEEKCLIVLDDIWSLDAWNNISKAIPAGDTPSKVILTTRKEDVAKRADPKVHRPNDLSPDDSWKLFVKKAYGGTDFKGNETMDELGRKMVEQCGGLPLAVVLLGGLLATKHTLREWQVVHQNLDTYLKSGNYTGGGQEERVLDVLALSYQDLPYQLKPCFLYLGFYDEDVEIEVERLYQMWIAEGLISQDEKGEEETMMDVAERYLDELAQRCIVQVKVSEEPWEMDFDRWFLVPELPSPKKTCRLHDLMRELCLLKVKEENFLKVIDHRKGNKQLSVHPSSSFSTTTKSIGDDNYYNVRRLAIYAGDENFVQNIPLLEHEERAQDLRTLILFARQQKDQFAGQLKHFCKDSPYLRTMLLHGIDGIPKEIGNLILLRYLGIRTILYDYKLPSSIANLRNLQTLDLRKSAGLILSDVLWKMKGLINLHLPLPFSTVNNRRLRLDGLSKLETLENVDSEVVDLKSFCNLTNLQTLKGVIIRANEEEFATVRNCITSNNRLRRTSISFGKYCTDSTIEGSIILMSHLLQCDFLVRLGLTNIAGNFPKYEAHLGKSLTTLALVSATLDEYPMATLGQLPNLRTLDLNCVRVPEGKEFVCPTHSFPRLEQLFLKKLDFDEWRVDEGAMLNLTNLRLWACRNLKMLPDGLKDISTLKELLAWILALITFSEIRCNSVSKLRDSCPGWCNGVLEETRRSSAGPGDKEKENSVYVNGRHAIGGIPADASCGCCLLGNLPTGLMLLSGPTEQQDDQTLRQLEEEEEVDNTVYEEITRILGLQRMDSDCGFDIPEFASATGTGEMTYDTAAVGPSAQLINGFDSTRFSQTYGLGFSDGSQTGEMKVLCSYGGKILPRPSDGKLR